MLDFDFLCGERSKSLLPRALPPPAHMCFPFRPTSHLHAPTVRAGRKTPSVAVIVQPGSSGGFQKVFFGREEVAIPQVQTNRLTFSSFDRPAVVGTLVFLGPTLTMSIMGAAHASRAAAASVHGHYGPGVAYRRPVPSAHALPCMQVGSIEEAAAAFPKADVFVNFASFR